MIYLSRLKRGGICITWTVLPLQIDPDSINAHKLDQPLSWCDWRAVDGNGPKLAGHHLGGNVRLDCAEKMTPGGKKVVWVRKERKRKMASNNSKYTSEYRQVIFQLIISSGCSATSIAEEMEIDKNTVFRTRLLY